MPVEPRHLDRARAGYTLIELLMAIAIVGAAAAAASYGRRTLGPVGSVIGAIAGATLACLVIWAWWSFERVWLKWSLRRRSSNDLRARLEPCYLDSPLIIAELVARGEPAESFRGFLEAHLRSPEWPRRRMAKINLDAYLPSSACDVDLDRT